MADALIGKTIGGYEILDVIGRGGMATVYRAQQVSMNRIVALKVLPEKYLNDDTYIQRFNQEVEIVAKLEHRNIVPVHDYGEHNGLPYIVMRYMSGGSVDDLLNNGPLEVDKIVDIIDQIAPALDYAHSKNVLHRDLKPSNVLLDDDGGAYLTDFGIARVLGEGASRGITTQGVVGTPSYMSPEQAQGLPLDNRSDIYALGVVLFELATGRRPFESDTPYSIAVMQVTTPPPSPRILNPTLSFAVEEVIFKALKKKREERFPHAVGVAEALKRAVNKPFTSVHDTQPGFNRPQPKPAAPPAPQPSSWGGATAVPPAPPSPAYTIPPAQPHTTGSPPRVPFRRRRANGTNVWVSAALGGLLGCGLLGVLVVIAVIIISLVSAGGQGAAATATLPPDERELPAGVPTLDPTSEAARATLLPAGIQPTSLADARPPTATPGIAPVGVRPTATLAATVRDIAAGLVYFAERGDNYDLFKLDLSTGAETQLTFDVNVDSYPAVSPDGRWIAFQSNRDGDFDIYVMDINGDDLRRLTDNDVLDRIPAWTPDGTSIIFSSDTRDDGNYDLYSVQPDGTGLTLLYSNNQRNSHPRFDPTGAGIVFTIGDGDNGATWEIGHLDMESRRFEAITDNDFKDWSPSYSPDGSRILFLTADGAQGDSCIAVMQADGSGREILFDGEGYEWGISFSPDGSYVTFTVLSSQTVREEVFIMRADGANVQQVTSEGGQAASWIPG